MNQRTVHRVLWTVQILLALLFTFAGVVKLMAPIAELSAQTGMPGLFLQFVSVCEILGALGLILPGAFGIRTALTPLAASGLILIMIGAITVTVKTMGVAPALIPFATGILLAFVVYGRTRLASLSQRVG